MNFSLFNEFDIRLLILVLGRAFGELLTSVPSMSEIIALYFILVAYIKNI